jgi:hypothetical protein
VYHISREFSRKGALIQPLHKKVANVLLGFMKIWEGIDEKGKILC